jgi:hypothetical protein
MLLELSHAWDAQRCRSAVVINFRRLPSIALAMRAGWERRRRPAAGFRFVSFLGWPLHCLPDLLRGHECLSRPTGASLTVAPISVPFS